MKMCLEIIIMTKDVLMRILHSLKSVISERKEDTQGYVECRKLIRFYLNAIKSYRISLFVNHSVKESSIIRYCKR